MTEAASPASAIKRPKSEIQKKIDRRAIIIATVVTIAVIALLAVVVAFLMVDPLRTANLRDIAIILFAIGSLVMSVILGVLLVILIYRIQELISFLRGEIVPILIDVQTTLKTVRGTTTFVSDNVARPTIKVASFVAGVQQMAKSANTKVRGRAERYPPASATMDQGEDYVTK
jgi:hypothetical protein